MEFNIWSDDNCLLKEIYKSDNYEIEILNPASKLCMICCSSNGLYFPNTEASFRKAIIEDNRYEWKNVFKDDKLRRKFGKVIYIRDIYKQWYVTGINVKADSVMALVELLKKEIQGYSTVTVGNSAGGYMAVLLGLLLESSHIYTFSGQFSIEDGIERNDFLKRYANDLEKNRFFNLIPYVKTSNIPIFYFYPANVDADCMQYNLISEFDNVYAFAFDEDEHGKTVYGMNYSYLFIKTLDKMKSYCKIYTNKKIKRQQFLLQTAGFFAGSIELCKKALRRNK